MAGPVYIWSKLKYQFASGFVILNLVHVLVLHFGFDISWQFALIDSLITNTILFLAVFFVVQFLSSYHRTKNNFMYSGIVAVIEASIAMFIITHLLGIIESDASYHQFLDDSLVMRWVIGIFVCVSMVKGFLLWIKIYHNEQEKSRVTISEDILKEAELQKLQHQLQPHFLFNSLNSINALIMINPDEASVMVTKLSEYLRYTSQKKDQQFVTIEEEFKNLNLYLEIEKVRFGHRLNIEKNISEECLTREIPTFILQPIVENAIKFGLYGTTEQVNIVVSVTCHPKEVIITVTNPFEKDMIPPKGTGFGIKGIKRRLYLLYARNDLMEVKEENNLFTATLKIPIKR